MFSMSSPGPQVLDVQCRRALVHADVGDLAIGADQVRSQPEGCQNLGVPSPPDNGVPVVGSTQLPSSDGCHVQVAVTQGADSGRAGVLANLSW
ncbi:hypothetical protein H7X46_08020 [Pseudonocardia sp. C8]|uniref:hypothetical protein n=1 Tax=Pseudonocardia sp. C8 TaxID=2762759 RepID=UPI001642E999|nr:hypothetical protein [Pseudonocardia sp. C8]MBC3191006.1 hypothetical protein [Pseudonocardia sp. C8]